MKKSIRCLIFISLLIHSTLAQKPAAGTPAKKWLTLTGQEPLVIAKGGFSGLFPESSTLANQMAIQASVRNVVLSCNVQLLKDGVGICASDIRLENSTNISLVFPKDQKSYNLNGKETAGWFATDFTSKQLFANVSLTQGIFSRSGLFDGEFPVSTVEDVAGQKPPQLWLNFQYDSFYTQQKLSVTSYAQTALKTLIVNYISSPEISFLKSMTRFVNRARTKLIFKFEGPDDVEPTTKQKYGSLVQNLPLIKSLASGILVPKEYIWPVKADGYLGAPSSLVNDAHKQGLEVYASGFATDIFSSYNYSYDPSAEYLQFVDNDQFAVDGVVTDFSPTASEAIACFAHNKNAAKPRNGGPLIISRNGASGIYSGCSDLSYQQAVDDGADILDCSVQLSKDGVAFCLDSADLMGETTAVTSFMTRTSTVTEIQPAAGIFSFDLTWSEIQTLKPQLANPFLNPEGLLRNPANKNQGKFMTFSEFLSFAKAKAVPGVLINIENAAYLASKKGLDIVGAVTTALGNATLDKSTQKVLIQSDDTSVLSKFKEIPTYQRVLTIKEKIGDAPRPAVEEIKKFADAVNIPRASIITVSDSFTRGMTKVVDEMHAGNISVYVYVLRNEYVALAFDYFSDPVVEIATYVVGGVDGLVTEYPGTAARYLRSPCTNTDPKAKVPYTILPAQPGSLLSVVPKEVQPPAQAPNPALDASSVVDPPLPATGAVSAPGPAASSGVLAHVANVGLSIAAVLMLGLLCV